MSKKSKKKVKVIKKAKVNPVLERILENYAEDHFLTAEGLDMAVIGVDLWSLRLIYSKKKCIEIFVKQDGMTEEDALEHFDFNVSGTYLGDQTPIWCDDTIQNNSK